MLIAAFANQSEIWAPCAIQCQAVCREVRALGSSECQGQARLGNQGSAGQVVGAERNSRCQGECPRIPWTLSGEMETPGCEEEASGLSESI